MKEQLRQAIEAVLKDCYAEGLLSSGEVPAEIQLEVPKNAEHGDFATNLAMMLAKPERKAPRQVAEILLPKLQALTICASVEIAGPGFINFRLSPSCWYELLDQITEQGAAYGKSKVGAGTRIQVEFVSANPTGRCISAMVVARLSVTLWPLFWMRPDTRSSVSTMLTTQVTRCRPWAARSGCACASCRAKPSNFQKTVTRGSTSSTWRRNILPSRGTLAGVAEAEAIASCSAFGVEEVLKWIAADLETFGIRFDNWYSEKSLYERNMVDKELATLKKKGCPSSRMMHSGCVPPTMVTIRTGC